MTPLITLGCSAMVTSVGPVPKLGANSMTKVPITLQLNQGSLTIDPQAVSL